MLHITNRELDVITLLAEGMTNKQIGEKLYISVHTVKKILENLYEKTSCHNRVQIVVFAIENNILN